MYISKKDVFSRIGIVFLLFLFIAACSRVPKGIIHERKMQQIVTDMHLVEALINADYYTYQSIEAKKALYQSVFDKHRVTEALYDSSLIWYGKHLDIYMQVYNMALNEVNKRIDAIGPIEPEKVYIPNKDSVDIWSIGRYHEFFPTAISNVIMFTILESEEYSSGSIFVLGMNVWGLATLSSPIEVHLRAEQRDTTVVVKNAITTDGYHEIILRSAPTQRIRQVFGYIRLNGNPQPYHKIYIDDLRMIKYLYGSEAVVD